MAAVMIGVDPHKGSHTAVAIGIAGEPRGQVRVRACAAEAERLHPRVAIHRRSAGSVRYARGV